MGNNLERLRGEIWDDYYIWDAEDRPIEANAWDEARIYINGWDNLPPADED